MSRVYEKKDTHSDPIFSSSKLHQWRFFIFFSSSPSIGASSQTQTQTQFLVSPRKAPILFRFVPSRLLGTVWSAIQNPSKGLVAMALLRRRPWENVVMDFRDGIRYSRFYSSKVDFKKLRPMILKRIQNRAKDYPIPHMVPVAKGVLRARARLIRGVSTLLRAFPTVTCKFCSEVYVGEEGHLIKTCCGPRRKGKRFLHQWVSGSLIDILVPVETFHLKNMFQGEIEHHQRFGFDRVPAILELCWQAGAHPNDETISTDNLPPDDLKLVAKDTFKAWETLRADLQRLLLVYPAKVCAHCSEVHVGPSGHKARLCGVFKYENWRGAHFWKKAEVEDLLPQKMVWRRRPYDPLLLRDEERGYYGHLPAVVELCVQGGLVPPARYECMMKLQGLPGNVVMRP